MVASVSGISIGALVNLLQQEFPEGDISISKIRFLEEQGIVRPARTKSGYRKFNNEDIDRLRYCIRMQTENFLPIKVICEHLEKIDRGFVPKVEPDLEPRVPDAVVQSSGGGALDLTGKDLDTVALSYEELATAANLSVQEIVTLREHKFIAFRPGHDYFGADALQIARYIAELKTLGLDARHLNPIKLAAQRQADLIEAILAPKIANSEPTAEQLSESANEVAALTLGLEKELLAVFLRGVLITE